MSAPRSSVGFMQDETRDDAVLPGSQTKGGRCAEYDAEDAGGRRERACVGAYDLHIINNYC